MQFNDSHAAEFGQDSGEVRAIYMLLGLTAASTLLPLSWEPRFQLQPLIQPPVRRVIPLACPCSVLGISTLVCRQLQTHPVPQSHGIRAGEQSGTSQSSVLHFVLPIC